MQHVMETWELWNYNLHHYKNCQNNVIMINVVADINPLRPRQNGCCFTDIFRFIFFNESHDTMIRIETKFYNKDPIYNTP